MDSGSKSIWIGSAPGLAARFIRFIQCWKTRKWIDYHWGNQPHRISSSFRNGFHSFSFYNLFILKLPYYNMDRSVVEMAFPKSWNQFKQNKCYRLLGNFSSTALTPLGPESERSGWNPVPFKLVLSIISLTLTGYCLSTNTYTVGCKNLYYTCDELCEIPHSQ